MMQQDVPTLRAGELEVRFVRHADRVGHEIWLRANTDWQPVLISSEGTPQEDWPASPPLQSAAVEQREPGAPLALLVGMAGKSHWSASVVPDAASDRLQFELATRVRVNQIAFLGSTYRLAPGWSAQPSGPLPGRVVLRSSERPDVRVVVEIADGFPPMTLNLEGERLTIAADQCAAVPATLRWGYFVTLQRD